MKKHKYLQTIIFLGLITFIGCNSIDKKEQNPTRGKEEIEVGLVDSSKIANKKNLSENTPTIDALEVMVVQCANGYEYAIHGYDFNPIVENELNRFKNIKVKPFPLKTLRGVSYQGVFDKKYCPPIIEKVDVDFLILTRFENGYNTRNGNKMKWGYKLKIVNTETLAQKNTIGTKGLNNFSEIEKHIKSNIETLKADIEELKTAYKS